MKYLLFSILIFGLLSCNQQSEEIKKLQTRIDSLELQLVDSYKPGFGELMSSIQSHHSKLWFAGSNTNWKLAEFEIKELKEIIEDITKYQKDREETKEMGMIFPELEKVSLAIKKKDFSQFEESYTQLTKSCNSCHKITNFEYNTVKIPETSPFTNQDFLPAGE